MPSSRIPATAAEMMIHSGSSYVVATPSTASISTENYRKERAKSNHQKHNELMLLQEYHLWGRLTSPMCKLWHHGKHDCSAAMTINFNYAAVGTTPTQRCQVCITHLGGLALHLDGRFICDELQCGLTFDHDSQGVVEVLQGDTHGIKTRSQRTQRVVEAQTYSEIKAHWCYCFFFYYYYYDYYQLQWPLNECKHMFFFFVFFGTIRYYVDDLFFNSHPYNSWPTGGFISVAHIRWVRMGQRTISLWGNKCASSHYCFLTESKQEEAVEDLIESSLMCLWVCVCVCVCVCGCSWRADL